MAAIPIAGFLKKAQHRQMCQNGLLTTQRFFLTYFRFVVKYLGKLFLAHEAL